MADEHPVGQTDPDNRRTKPDTSFRQRMMARFPVLDWQFVRSTSLNSVGIAVSRVLGFAYAFLVARAFSPADYGYTVYAITLAGLLAIVSQPFGQHVVAYLVGKYHKDEANFPDVASNTWVVGLGLFALSLLASVPLLAAVGRLNWEILVVYVGLVAHYTYFGLASGFLAPARAIIAYLLSNIIQLVLVLALIYGLRVQSTAPIVAVYGVSYFIPLIWLTIFRPLPIRFRVRVSPTHIREILRYAAPVFLSHALFLLSASADVLLLEHFVNNTAVGIYGLTRTLTSVFTFMPNGITMLLMPRIAGSTAAEQRKLVQLALGVAFTVNIVGLALYLLLYRWFVVTFFGADYFLNMQFALIMALAEVAGGTHAVVSAVFFGSGRVQVDTISRLGMLVLMWGLGVVLIPTCGLMGAAYTVFITWVGGLIVFGLLSVVWRRRASTATG